MQGTVNVYATAAHIRDTDTCTDDAHDTAMVIITAQAQLDDNESSDVTNASNSNRIH